MLYFYLEAKGKVSGTNFGHTAQASIKPKHTGLCRGRSRRRWPSSQTSVQDVFLKASFRSLYHGPRKRISNLLRPLNVIRKKRISFSRSYRKSFPFRGPAKNQGGWNGICFETCHIHLLFLWPLLARWPRGTSLDTLADQDSNPESVPETENVNVTVGFSNCWACR